MYRHVKIDEDDCHCGDSADRHSQRHGFTQFTKTYISNKKHAAGNIDNLRDNRRQLGNL